MQITNILIVDDDVEDLEIFQMAVQQINPGVNVRTAVSKEELFIKLESNLPDIVFIDSVIQHESGLSFITELKESEKYRDLPVIMYTGSDDIKNISKAFAYGVSGYIVKPQRLSEVKYVLQHSLHRNWKTDLRKEYYSDGKFQNLKSND